MFGKGADGASVVDKGLVVIPTKYSSYKKKDAKTVSLDELRENPAFDERTVKPLERDIYKRPRQHLDKTLPELEPLRAEIARLQHVYDVAIGKATDPSLPLLTQTQVYHLNHQLISLKSQQYIVKDSAVASVDIRPRATYTFAPEADLVVWPLGTYFGTSQGRFDAPRLDGDGWWDNYRDWADLAWSGVAPDRVVDFTNGATVREVIDHYEGLLEAALDNPPGDAAQLIATLDWYEAEAHLAPSRHDMYMYKKARWPNRAIRDRINRDYAKKYNENYVSTIYTRDVCGAIAAAARLHYTKWNERHNPSAWKKCSKCGAWRLKEEEFHRKNTSSDGYNAQCIWCEMEKRAKRKAENARRNTL